METTLPRRSDTPAPPTEARPRAALLAVVLLADVTCLAVVMPLLASYAAAFGAGTTAIGPLVAAYSAMHVLLAPLWGRISDRLGRRPILLVGLLGTVLGSLLFAAARSFAVLLLSRIVAGGLGATLIVAQAYAADESGPERRTRAMGLIGAAFGVGFVIGPAIGAVSSRLGDAGPGLVAAAIAAGNLLLVLLALPEPRRRTARPSALPLRELSGRHLVAPFAAAFCSTLAFTVIYVVFPLHAEWALGLDRSRVGWLFALVGLVAAVVQGLVVGRLAQRAGEGRVVQLGGLGMAAGLVLLPLVATEGAAFLPPGFLIALALTGAGVGLTSPAEAGYVSRATGPAEQGRALGLLQSVNAVARITGPVLAGVVMEWRGATAAFGTAAGVAVVAAAAGRGMRRRTSDEG